MAGHKDRENISGDLNKVQEIEEIEVIEEIQRREGKQPYPNNTCGGEVMVGNFLEGEECLVRPEKE